MGTGEAQGSSSSMRTAQVRDNVPSCHGRAWERRPCGVHLKEFLRKSNRLGPSLFEACWVDERWVVRQGFGGGQIAVECISKCVMLRVDSAESLAEDSHDIFALWLSTGKL